MRVVIDRVLARPLERVFAFVSDPRNRPLWQRATRSVELSGDGPVGVGTRWRETSSELGTYEVRVAALEPGRLWVEEADAEAASGTVSVAFAPRGPEATAVTVTVEATLHGRRRLMEPLVAPMVRREMGRDLDRLERLLGDPADEPG